jgi:hypothetical protein
LSYWRAEPIWKSDTCYIIGGGPSLLTQDKNQLDGQKLIVINSSYLAFARAQFCIFSDMRWWCDHLHRMQGFNGDIISTSNAASQHPRLHIMQRKTSPGLAEPPDQLMVKNTTLTAAINLAVHFGVAKIVLLGIDQKAAADGNHWHHMPHKWKPTSNCFQRQQSDLPKIAEGLTARNIECVNASPGSALKLWPIVNLEDHVEPIACDRDAGIRRQHIPTDLRQDAGPAA